MGDKARSSFVRYTSSSKSFDVCGSVKVSGSTNQQSDSHKEKKEKDNKETKT